MRNPMRLVVGVVVFGLLASACGHSPTSPAPIDPTLLQVSTTILPSGSQGASYSFLLAATGGHPPFSWSAVGLPPGITAMPSGMLTGTFQNRGSWQITVNVTDTSAATATKQLMLAGGYESLPTARRYLVDANGNPTHMWAQWLSEPSPPRGSVITIGTGVCPSGCFTGLSVAYGMDSGIVPNPNTSVLFHIGFSQDGVNIIQNLAGDTVNGTGGTGQTNPALIQAFNIKPAFLVVWASFDGDLNGQYGTFPGETGTLSFLYDGK